MATRIFIDGYNMLWASDTHRPEAIRNFEHSREELIARIAASPRLKRHKVTLVFDAHKSGGSEGSSEKVKGIKVRFTRGGQQADDVLKEMAKQYSSGAIIISSDREVARYAEKKGCGVIGSHEFDRLLDEPVYEGEFDEEEDSPNNNDKKGPARRDPKARRRALARLR